MTGLVGSGRAGPSRREPPFDQLLGLTTRPRCGEDLRPVPGFHRAPPTDRHAVAPLRTGSAGCHCPRPPHTQGAPGRPPPRAGVRTPKDHEQRPGADLRPRGKTIGRWLRVSADVGCRRKAWPAQVFEVGAPITPHQSVGVPVQPHMVQPSVAEHPVVVLQRDLGLFGHGARLRSDQDRKPYLRPRTHRLPTPSETSSPLPRTVASWP